MSAKFVCSVEIVIEAQRAGHFAYQILMDGYPYETSDACSAAAALTAAALWLNRKCRKCGCTFLNGCADDNDPADQSCHWVKPNLCSHCAKPAVKKARRP
jgi:hypothetical protein